MKKHGAVLVVFVLVATVVLAGVLFSSVGERGAPPEAHLVDRPAELLPGSQPVQFSDPSDDATDATPSDPVTQAGCAASPATGSCVDPPAPAPRPTAPPARPAPPLDIVGGGVDGETADALLLSLGLAELHADWSDVSPLGMERVVHYLVCWSTFAGGPCDHLVVLRVLVRSQAIQASAAFEIRSSACNVRALCQWGVPATIVSGAPGRILWTVPKSLLTADGSALAVADLHAETGWTEAPEGVASIGVAVSLETLVPGMHSERAAPAATNTCDTTVPIHVEAALTAPSTAGRGVGVLLQGALGTLRAQTPDVDAALDLLSFDLQETPERLLATFTVARLDAVPSVDFDYAAVLGIGDRVWDVGWHRLGGEADGYVGPCVHESCAGATLSAAVEVQTGAPGRVTVEVPWTAIRSPSAGMQIVLAQATTAASTTTSAHGAVTELRQVDALYGGRPWAFALGAGSGA